jgi:uncharacterized protein YegP (UPF0339 family)
MGAFQLYRDQNNEYRWRLRSNNNRVVADSSEGYLHRADCEHGIELMRQLAEAQLYRDKRGEYRWRGRAANHRIFADSGEGYVRRSGCARAVEKVKQIAHDATVDDRTSVGRRSRHPEAPIANFSHRPRPGEYPLAVHFDGNASADLNGALLDFAWKFGDGSDGEGAVVDHTYPARGCFPVELTVTGSHGFSSATEELIDVGVELSLAPWEDPAKIPLVPANAHLYSGPDAVQIGVPEGAIDSRRAAVLHGRVLDDGGSPIAGVLISVIGHPEFGSTTSLDDGTFDMAVNGGAILLIHYEREQGTVDRQAYARTGEDAFLPDLVFAQDFL